MKDTSYKIRYLRAYIHFRTGVLISYIQDPANEDQYILLQHMYHVALTYMTSIGKQLRV